MWGHNTHLQPMPIIFAAAITLRYAEISIVSPDLQDARRLRPDADAGKSAVFVGGKSAGEKNSARLSFPLFADSLRDCKAFARNGEIVAWHSFSNSKNSIPCGIVFAVKSVCK
jgi:hypothetical protein